jgi:hypothetical protein
LASIAAPIPEPSSCIMLVTGISLPLVVMALRRRLPTAA